MEPIRSIAELPFRERPALELLDLETFREAPDLESVGYGYCRVDTIWLETRGGRELRISDVLLLAFHVAEGPEPLSDDVELEFFVPEVAEGYSVTVLLSDFLARWLPRVSGGERAMVLAMCNPLRARLGRPERAGTVPVYCALGDVDSWLALEDGQSQLRLVADEWRQAE